VVYWLSWLCWQGQLLLELDGFRHCWEIQTSSNGFFLCIEYVERNYSVYKGV